MCKCTMYVQYVFRMAARNIRPCNACMHGYMAMAMAIFSLSQVFALSVCARFILGSSNDPAGDRIGCIYTVSMYIQRRRG